MKFPSKNYLVFLDSENKIIISIQKLFKCLFVMEIKAKTFSQDFSFGYLSHRLRSEKKITYLKAAFLLSDREVIEIV